MKSTTHVPSFEALETRALMSGNVLATVAPATGNLTIVYDPANTGDLAISVTKDGTNVTVTQTDGTTRVNGSENPVIRGGVTGTITITMGSGDDYVVVGEEDSEFRVAAPTAIPHYKNFVVNMGAGNDSLTIYRLGAANVSIVNGLGNNTTVLDGGSSFFSLAAVNDGRPAVGPVVAGTLSITGGAGDDTVSILGNVVVTKACTINNAAGTNQTTFSNNDGRYAPRFAKTLAITGGVDSDTVTVRAAGADESLFVAGKMTLTMGAGNNNFYVDMLNVGTLSYTGTTGDDTIGGPGVAAVGTITIAAGDAADGDTLLVHDIFQVVLGTLFEFDADQNHLVGYAPVTIGANVTETSNNLVTAIKEEIAELDNIRTYAEDGEGGSRVVTLTWNTGATAGNGTVSVVGANLSETDLAGGLNAPAVGPGYELTVRKSLTLAMGAGTNVVGLSILKVLGAFAYTGGIGSDTFTIDDEIEVGGFTTFTMAAGQNTLDVNTAYLDGNLTYTGGANVDHVTLNDTHVIEITKITTLAGDDDATIGAGSEFAGVFTLDMGAGEDLVDIASEAGADLAATNFFDAVSILGGTEDDTVTIGADRTSRQAVRFYDLLTKFDGGAGLDDNLSNVDVLYSFIPTILGFDHLSGIPWPL